MLVCDFIVPRKSIAQVNGGSRPGLGGLFHALDEFVSVANPAQSGMMPLRRLVTALPGSAKVVILASYMRAAS